MNDQTRLDRLSEAQLREKLATGDLSDEDFQEAMRRQAASRRVEDLPNSTDRTTAEGFGSGQGMEHSDMGQGLEDLTSRTNVVSQDRRGERGLADLACR